MDGDFMRKFCIFTSACVLVAGLLWLGSVERDRRYLKENVIRLHVVAHSDSPQDQAVKLAVRDAVTEYLEPELAGLSDVEAAREFLRDHLQELKAVADGVLAREGFSLEAAVTLDEEAFSTRQYDTFSLPAGVYDALRITLGQGQGKNWWCVVFPGLCLPATSQGFADTAAGAGFSQELTGTLEQEQGYEIRFFVLDCLGWLENFFHRG